MKSVMSSINAEILKQRLDAMQAEALNSLPAGQLTRQAPLFRSPVGTDVRPGLNADALRDANFFDRKPSIDLPKLVRPELSRRFPVVEPPSDRFSRQQIDFAQGHANTAWARLFDPARRQAAEFERLLQNPGIRAQFEKAIGGRIVDDARDDGVISIRRFGSPFEPGSGAGRPPQPGFGFPGQAEFLKGLLALIERITGGQASSFGSGNAGDLGAPGSSASSPGSTPGGSGATSGGTSTQSSGINADAGGAKSTHQAEIDSIMNDRSMTIEDKITLMLLVIMKKMDKDIEDQAKKLDTIQQQQGGGDKPGQGGGSTGGGGQGGPGQSTSSAASAGSAGAASSSGQSPSIDAETLKLKRSIEKRGQMFDMLRQIIDRYNQTSKGVIDSIGRT